MLPVSDASCGGAEQMLWTLEHEMSKRGYKTTLAGCEGSCISGELIATGKAPSIPDAFEFRSAEHSRRIAEELGRRQFDLVHDKSGFWWEHAGQCAAPVLATLHLPRNFYPERLFRHIASNIFFNAVSESQAKSFKDIPRFIGVVPNGIVLQKFPFTRKKGDYALWLGRICPEKAPHLAMDAAQQAGIPLVLAGEVYPFRWHQEYFDTEIRPRLERSGEGVRWVQRPAFDEKLELLRNAKVLLLSTQAPETSSLVAMEAAACGTPAIAFPKGAVPEIVAHGISGFLVDGWREMGDAIADLDRLWPEDARDIAEERFCSRQMANGYERLYDQISAEAQQCRKFAV